jgi:hypothetical protein
MSQEFSHWLAAHVQEMTTLPCFSHGTWYQDVLRTGTSQRFVAIYGVPHFEAWNDYLANFAARMRAQLPKAWAEAVQFQRLLLEERSEGFGPGIKEEL